MAASLRSNLLDILLVVVVLLVLLAILFPVHGGGGPSPRNACLSNVKQIGTGTLIYMADHDEWLPVSLAPPRPTAVGWAQRIYPYTKNAYIFADPVEISELDDSERKHPRVSYAINANGTDLPNAAVKAQHPERSLLFFEVANARQGRARELHSTLSLSPAGDGTADGLLDSIDPNVPPVVHPATGPLVNSGIHPKHEARHKGMANYSYLDGHAKYLLPGSVTAGGNAAKPTDPPSDRGCRRAELGGLARPCAEGSANATQRATFSLR